MTKIWWAQIQAVIRLELKRTLLARRGIWIYVLALLPLVLFLAHAVVVSHDRNRSNDIAARGAKHLTYQDLQAIKPEMTRQEVIYRLGGARGRFQCGGHGGRKAGA